MAATVPGLNASVVILWYRSFVINTIVIEINVPSPRAWTPLHQLKYNLSGGSATLGEHGECE